MHRKFQIDILSKNYFVDPLKLPHKFQNLYQLNAVETQNVHSSGNPKQSKIDSIFTTFKYQLNQILSLS